MRITFLALFLLALSSCSRHVDKIDLSGAWRVQLLDDNFKGKFYDISLPGTTDEAHIGYADTLEDKLEKPQVLHLTRSHSYVGKALYSRNITIPASLGNKELELYLERVLWASSVKVDGNEIEGQERSLVTPHIHRLPPLEKGEHTLEFLIDNSKLLEISDGDLCHSYTNDTQVMWNGVLGEISLKAVNRARLSRVETYPDKSGKKVDIVVYGEWNDDVQPDIKVCISRRDGKGKTVARAKAKGQECRLTVEIEDARLWNEFHPDLYDVEVIAEAGDDSDAINTSFGMRQIECQDGKICINGNPVFLRGTLECCIFPLTGTPPTDETGWEKVIKTAKEWGLNHLRFHSWCPPDAAFRVADRLGFYLSVELPVWSLNIGNDPGVMAFMEDEMERIIRFYGNHPSLCMISNGNELQYDFGFLNSLTAKAKKRDARHLYITTSFTFEKGHGGHNEPEDQYYVSQWTDNGWVRGQGVFDKELPSFDKNYDSAMGCLSVPLVSHEIGQYSVYPDLKETASYTGTLIPHNFKAIEKDLKEKGRLDRAEDYLQASGHLAAILYKEECERAMKTNGLSGYQLLGLQDFSGQGTALVGMVNAFWQSKGIVTPGWFRQFCSPVVPLANFSRAVWENCDTLNIGIQISNYLDRDIENKTLRWSVLHQDSSIYREGTLEAGKILPGRVNTISDISIPLLGIRKAEKMTICLDLQDTDYHNSWDIWVYNSECRPVEKDIVLTQSLSTAIMALEEGRKVLFSPALGNADGIEGKFVPVFWSPVHFPKQAGTMGLLCDPGHPAFRSFPTDSFGNWQWWRLEKRSTVTDITKLSGVSPIVEVVDNFMTNRHLSTVFETRCLKGQLLFSSIDLLSKESESPESRQLLFSLLDYMSTEDFCPKGTVKVEELEKFIR